MVPLEERPGEAGVEEEALPEQARLRVVGDAIARIGRRWAVVVA
jgi:hypothetical protein